MDDELKTAQKTLRIAKNVNRWAMHFFIVGLLSLFVFAGDWLYMNFRFSFDTKPKIEATTPRPIPKLSIKDNESLPIDKNHKPQEESGTEKIDTNNEIE